MAAPSAKQERTDQAGLVSGQGKYVDDLSLPGMLYMGVVRSPHAHAKILSVDMSAVREMPGVVGTLELEELMRETKPLPLHGNQFFGGGFSRAKTSKTYAMANGVVSYVGEPVAVVVAESPEQARDAVDAVLVDYDSLPAVSNLEEATKESSPLVYDEWGTNVMFEQRLEKGNAKRAFATADHIVETRVEIARQVSGAIEPRGVIVDYDVSSGTWRLHSQTKTPFQTKNQLSEILKVDGKRIEVIAVDTGGNFGIKGRVYPEDIFACVIARKLGRPIKWIATRNEDILSSWQGRGQLHKIRIAFDSKGKILAIENRFAVDVGSYWLFNLASMRHAFGLSTGAYHIPNLDLEGRAVVTNKVPFGTVRGNGRPEAIFVVERIIDTVAAELHKDPLDVRLENILRPEDLPYDTGTGSVLDSGDYVKSIQILKEISKYQALREMQQSSRKEGRLIGIGVTSYVEDTGNGSETASLSLLPDGRLQLVSGTSPSGQGIERVLRQLVADKFDVPISEVSVICGNTAMISHGTGTFGSRSAVLAGNAANSAAEKLKKKLQDYAKSHKLGQGLDLKAVAREAVARKALDSMHEFVEFETEAATFSFGAHLAVVEVDKESFDVKVLKYFAVDDAGRILNRANVEGQVIGGIANGLGNAILENFVVNEDGQPLAATFADYLLPAPTDMPMVEAVITETPSTSNPLGVRGVGEGGTMGALPSIVSAVEDALSPLGIRITSAPTNQASIWALGKKSRKLNPVAPEAN